MTIIAIVVSIICIAIAIFLFIKAGKSSKAITELEAALDKYKGISDIEKAVKSKEAQLSEVEGKITSLNTDFMQKEGQLRADYETKKSIFDQLSSELAAVEESIETISFGLYKPHYQFDSSETYKQELERIYELEKQCIKDEKATFCSTKWTVGGSTKEGEKMVKQGSKLMLRAFNGEADSAISKVSWNNITNMEARIQKAYEAINKLGSSNQIIITEEYYNLKMQELRLEFELEEKIRAEKEEQRAIKEELREQEKALAEIEKARKEAEDEELRYQKALEKAKQDLQTSSGKELDKLNDKIKQLETNLQQAHEQKERAMSRAQMTKSGHVYVISNIGSFGESVYKIGMTRRLEPTDRVKELSDASVPFDFDIHAMIYSENAPELENRFHRKLEEKRINLVNDRREFFNVEIEEVEKIAKELNHDIQLTKLAEAKEFRQTISLRNSKITTVDEVAKRNQTTSLPSSI